MFFALLKDNIPCYLSDNNGCFYVGKYGETLHFTEIGDRHIFSSSLGEWDKKVDTERKIKRIYRLSSSYQR